MKKIRNTNSSGLTMTVKELREALSNYADDMPVVAIWEGVVSGIRVENFEINASQFVHEIRLEIDVENYG